MALTLAVLGSLSHTATHDAQFDAGASVVATGPTLGATTTARAIRAPTPPQLLGPRGSRPPATPAEIRLQRSMTRNMRQAGPVSGALVYDMTAGTELYAVHPTVARPPASVEKIWTTAALMLKLGPDARMHTAVLGRGFLRHGVWHGNLYLRGGGDPTFGDQAFNQFWNHGYGPTPNQLVAQLRAHGIHRVTGRVYADESMFDRRRGGLLTGYAVDTPDFGGQLSALTFDHGTALKHYSPATFAARQLALTMRGSGITARASTHAARTPASARLLASVSSPPLSVMVRLMDVPSDDLFAELFTKQLGVRFGHGGTISAGAHVIAQTIASTYGLHPRILDGSGLGRQDRTSPLQMVQLLREMWGTRVGREVAAALPTVGRQGTVAGFGLKSPATGRCVAKTGSLDYVSNLAGYCRARDHHALAFALFVDGPPNGTGFTLESRMVGDIARY
ncbi:MAG TPA: D-alanyl-D-alanine carboxypeptidase [Solirubrobacteraceae bacterium]|nr:D-alanyl-D-alanine carboxypeptidase [Solirubrobacteraceae bacterium]